MTGIVIEITGEPTFTAPVSLSRPGKEPAVVDFTFKHKTRDELVAWGERARAPGASTADLLSEIVADWGAQIAQPYSPEALRILLQNYHTADVDIAKGYRKALAEAREKN